MNSFYISKADRTEVRSQSNVNVNRSEYKKYLALCLAFSQPAYLPSMLWPVFSIYVALLMLKNQN